MLTDLEEQRPTVWCLDAWVNEGCKKNFRKKPNGLAAPLLPLSQSTRALFLEKKTS